MAMLVLLSACSKDDNAMNPGDNGATIQALNSLVISADWEISEFIDSGTNETGDFSGFTFTFNADGTLVAENGSETIAGTWSVTDDDMDDSSNDNSNEDIDFNIFFASPPDFSELTEDWQIVSHSASRIELIHVSGGNGGTDTLIFIKT